MLYIEELYLNLNVGVVTHDLSNEGSLFQIEEVLNENDLWIFVHDAKVELG